MTTFARLALTALGASLFAHDTCAQGGATYRISLGAGRTEANGRSSTPVTDAQGFKVVFASAATNLVPGDTNNRFDLFVVNVTTGAIERVSVSSTGQQANDASFQPDISADGRWVTFVSQATNLVPGDTNGQPDVFLRDLQNGTTTLISAPQGGGQANLDSGEPSISGDGNYIAFHSHASNLVSGDTNGWSDIFVYDRTNGQITRESIPQGGGQANDDCFSPAISDDGRYVAFQSYASSLTGSSGFFQEIYRRDRIGDSMTRVTFGNSDSETPDISANGQHVVFVSYADNLVPGDTNGFGDIFVADVPGGTVERVNVDDLGAQAFSFSSNPSISADGRFVAFQSNADNLTSLSSFATDIFVRDRQASHTQICNLTSEGYTAQDQSSSPVISGDGRVVVFVTDDSGLVPADVNGEADIVMHERSHHLSSTGTAGIGQTVTLSVRSPADAGKLYAILASANTQFGIPFGNRLFPLDSDPLLNQSTSTPSVFQNFLGNLDGNGEVTAFIHIPNNPALVNLDFFVAYAVITPGHPNLFSGFSNALGYTIQ